MNNYNHNGGPDLADDAANPYGVDGYIKVARAMRFHPFVGCGHGVKPADPERGHSWSRHEAWEDLICECRYRDGHIMNKGRLMEVKPGQLLGAVSWLGNRWNWTPHTVRWFLDKLEELGMIERRSDLAEHGSTQISHNQNHENYRSQRGASNRNQINLITVCNYKIYQSVNDTEPRPIVADKPQAHREQTASAPQHLNKGRKEEDRKDIRPGSDALPLQLEDQPDPESAVMADIIDIYNLTAKKCKIGTARLTDKRKKLLRAHLKTYNLNDWRKVMANWERSAFLCGSNPKATWHADLDFFLRHDKFQRALEGGYGNGRHAAVDPMDAERELAQKKLDWGIDDVVTR